MKQLRLYIYAFVTFVAGSFLSSCGDEGEALLYGNYDFMEISGDSVISRKGLQMVASTIYTEGDTSYVKSQVTVSTHVFEVSFAFRGKENGNYNLGNHDGIVLYRELLEDSVTFKNTEYLLRSGSINWEDQKDGTALLDVDLKGTRYYSANDSILPYPSINIIGKIRAIKNKTR